MPILVWSLSVIIIFLFLFFLPFFIRGHGSSGSKRKMKGKTANNDRIKKQRLPLFRSVQSHPKIQEKQCG
jgi:hypothetical protein